MCPFPIREQEFGMKVVYIVMNVRDGIDSNPSIVFVSIASIAIITTFITFNT